MIALGDVSVARKEITMTPTHYALVQFVEAKGRAGPSSPAWTDGSDRLSIQRTEYVKPDGAD